jgi:hypothetical protein
VDDDACSARNPVPGVGHFKRTLLGKFWRAPKKYWAMPTSR